MMKDNRVPGLAARLLWVRANLIERLGFTDEAAELREQAWQLAMNEGMFSFSPDDMEWLIAEGLEVSGDSIYLPQRGAPKLLIGIVELETAFAYGFTGQAWSWLARQSSSGPQLGDQVYLTPEEGFLPGWYTITNQ